MPDPNWLDELDALEREVSKTNWTGWPKVDPVGYLKGQQMTIALCNHARELIDAAKFKRECFAAAQFASGSIGEVVAAVQAVAKKASEQHPEVILWTPVAEGLPLKPGSEHRWTGLIQLADGHVQEAHFGEHHDGAERTDFFEYDAHGTPATLFSVVRWAEMPKGPTP